MATRKKATKKKPAKKKPAKKKPAKKKPAKKKPAKKKPAKKKPAKKKPAKKKPAKKKATKKKAKDPKVVQAHEAILKRMRKASARKKDVLEKRMFGGSCFLVAGNMACGLTGENALMVRVGPDAYEDALAQPHARPMDFTGRPMKGMVFVDDKGFAADADLKAWMDRGFKFARSLPPKV
jgi:hypothetical protein